MAITDIPEFVELAPGGLIRSEDWNNIQRQARNSIRAHRHTRAAAAPPNDAASADLALQITTDEIADQAVTNAKLGNGAVTAGKLADGSVTGSTLADLSVGTVKIQNGSIVNEKLQANAVDRANIRDGAINLPKLALQEVASANGQSLASGGSLVTLPVKNNVPNAQALAAPFFPTLTIASLSAGTGEALVEAAIVYRRTPTSPAGTVDVQIRLRNTGTLGATVNWRVLTFAP